MHIRSSRYGYIHGNVLPLTENIAHTIGEAVGGIVVSLEFALQTTNKCTIIF